MNTTARLAIAATLAITVSPSSAIAQTPNGFRRVGAIGVEGVAEIVDASDDGRRLIYTNSDKEELGLVDISNASRPRHLTTIKTPGEPTSVSVAGRYAVATVWADKASEGKPAPKFSAGKLLVIDLGAARPRLLGTVDVGWHPDSVKLTRVGRRLVAVVAIENEPVVLDDMKLVTDEDRPGSPKDVSPAGLIQVVTIDTSDVTKSTVVDLALPETAMSRAKLLYPKDPQPEFVDVYRTRAAISLQENNGVAIVDFSNPAQPKLERLFSLGTVSDRFADLSEDDAISFSETYPKDVDGVKHDLPEDAGGKTVAPGSRFPDSLAFSPDGTTIYTADEGEMNYTGGRGFSAWSTNGRQVWDDGGLLEQVAWRLSHYPEGRSENKGIEIEGIATARFGRRDIAMVMSERGSFLSLWDITSPAKPQLMQILGTGIEPEGVVAIPSRNLIVTSAEESGTMTIFQGGPSVLQSPNAPQLFSTDTPWAALSGLAGGLFGNYLWAVPDNAIDSGVFFIEVGGPWARVYKWTGFRKDGKPVRYDGEGIARDTSMLSPWIFGGFWIANEGNASSRPNLLVQTSLFGDVQTEIQLPNAIDPAADASLPGRAQAAAGGQKIRSNGFEGVSLSTDGRYAYAVIQRDFANEFPTGKRYARIARYDLRQLRTPADRARLCKGVRCGGDWDFFFYELDSNDASNWAGLSEILSIGDNQFLVVERDKGIGVGSKLKKLYAFTLDGVRPDRDGKPDRSDTVRKVLSANILRDFFPLEKVEGLALTRRGYLWVGLDNDGGEVESRLINKGRFRNPLRR